MTPPTDAGARIGRSEDQSAREIAREATVHSFLNCYLRETGDGRVLPLAETPLAGSSFRADEDLPDRVVQCSLDRQGIDYYVPLSYESPTGRHLFDLPAAYVVDDVPLELDYLTLATLATKELDLTRGGDARHDLLARIVRSCEAIERFVDGRRGDPALTDPSPSFREGEQSLVFGHHLHPTPKSRGGLADPAYEPELGGSFQLHYVRVDPALVDQDAAREGSAAAWVEDALRADPAVSEDFVAEHVESDDVLIPMHPWQAEHVLDRPLARDLREQGRLESLGQAGRAFAPTSSIRTLYAEQSPFMVKTSLAVQVTNSVRTNKRPELRRGVAITELLDTGLGAELRERFPGFDVVRDPAYLTVAPELCDSAGEAVADGERPESGFEVVLRDNPFRGEDAARSMPVVALCQDPISGPSRLQRLIEGIAEREGRDAADVSEAWFREYLAVSVRPLLWLYLARGVGLEAHQQNSVLSLGEAGYPETFRYRDNQGYYFPEGGYERVEEYCPGVGERADTLCPDAVADERIRYYVLLNNAFGVINAFGTAGLVDERRLLAALREELEGLREHDRPSSSLLEPLLSSEAIPCKANLLTRFDGLDELDAPSLDEQSVYADVTNPLVTELDRQPTDGDAGAAVPQRSPDAAPEVDR